MIAMKTAETRKRIGLAATILSAATLLTGCSYSPERNYVEIGNAVSRPDTYTFAVAVEYRRFQSPTGFLNRFPNGGIPRILERDARIYSVDLDTRTIELRAEVEDFAGIPQPKHVRIEGWRDDFLYFSLFGYGGDQRTGDDLSDERRLIYVIDTKGGFQRVNTLPTDLTRTRNSGPLPQPPFLRLSAGHRDIDVGIDGRPYQAERRARFVLDDQTGEPLLVMPVEE